MQSRDTARIKIYNQDRGFGFVTTSQGEDLFFHVSAVLGLENEDELKPGRNVTYEISDKHGRPRAIDVRLLSEAD